MPTSSYLRTLAVSALCASLSLTLTSCGDAKVKPSSEKPQVAAPVTAKGLMDRASIATSPERESLFLQAAKAYLDSDRHERALSALNEINPDQITDTQFAQFARIKSAISLKDGSTLDAFTALTDPRIEQLLPQLSPPQAIELREQRGNVFALLGEYEAAVEERFLVAELASSRQQQQKNNNSLWSNLLSMPLSRLEYLSENAPNETARGWYNLATIGKNTEFDLIQQQSMINQWRRQWAAHPAANQLPDDLSLIKDLIATQPKHIALLLPLQGKLKEAGEAVRDGFYAAYYQSLANGRDLPEVSTYDSSDDIITAYQDAVAGGADLIIGPLEKEKVTELANYSGLNKPILALNYADSGSDISNPNFYQFGLAVEDEARQVARQAYADGHRQAMLMITDQEWSERSSRAFADEWTKLGGKVIDTRRFKIDENFSRLIKNAMLIEESQERSRQLEALLGSELKTAPRSRADVDMIFLIANPVQARQIKPAFAYHFASKIPIYATSQVYSGESNPKLDRDLNGIRFNTMPWLFDTSSERITVKKHSTLSAVYDRLQALGIDAFRVYARLPQLVRVEQMRVYGATGTLRMLPDGRIEREQVWASFRGGVAQPQSTSSKSDAE